MSAVTQPVLCLLCTTSLLATATAQSLITDYCRVTSTIGSVDKNNWRVILPANYTRDDNPADDGNTYTTVYIGLLIVDFSAVDQENMVSATRLTLT